MGPVDVENIDFPRPFLRDIAEGADDEVDIFPVVHPDRRRDIAECGIEGEALCGVVALLEPIDAEDVAPVLIGECEGREAPVEADVDDCLGVHVLHEPNSESLVPFPGTLDRIDKMQRTVNTGVMLPGYGKRKADWNCGCGQFPSKRKENYSWRIVSCPKESS